VNDAELERLFRDYHPQLVRFLTRQLGDRDRAEELAQETFLRALRQDRLTNERAWLFTVANNLVRDEVRRDTRRRHHLTLLQAEERAREADASQPVVERAEDAALARQALGMLAERDRQALLMREEGLDYNEIAGALELSVGSIGTTLARARRRLVEAYEALQRSAGASHAAS
jgi:RNA polymerase sigma-70 factor (ECF subfamily)